MTDILNSYFLAFFHPFETQSILRNFRLEEEKAKKTQPFKLVGTEDHEGHINESIGVNFIEVLCVSWVMALFRAIYALMAIYLGLYTYNWYSGNSGELSSFMGLYQKWIIFSLIIKVVLFPIALWLYSRFWFNIIKLFTNLFKVDEETREVNEEAIQQVINNSLTTHTFLIIPLFGEMIFHIATLVYLFAGLRNNLKMTTLQSMTVLIFPLFILMMAVLLMTISIMMLVAALM